MLSQRYPREMLERALVPRSEWHPFPTIDDRAAWEGLPQSVRAAYLAQGELAQGEEWPVLLAVRYLDYSRDGNRTRFSTPRSKRRAMLAALTVAECIENQGRFLDDVVNGIWLICEESSWCVPAHVGVQRAGYGLPDTAEPIVDLFAAETSVLLSWMDYLLGGRLDTVSPLVRPRVQREIDARILTPCMERDDFWWMGFGSRRVNNWNPWINSNWLASALLMEADPVRRVAAVAKSARSLDRFIDPYPADGGCDEGPGYWGRAGASLLDCLELLYSATEGQVDVYAEPLVQEIGRFIYRVQIAGDYFVNFADASAVVMPPAHVVWRYGQRIGDAKMMSMGAWIAVQQDLLCRKGAVESLQRVGLARLLPTLFSLDEILAADPTPPLPRDVWLPEIQVMVARDVEGSSEGLYLAAKGGHNAESHNHNDVGSFVVYVDGAPVLVDAGVETYTRKTFSAERYTIWTMRSGYHTLLPTVDGVMQAPGIEFSARGAQYSADDDQATLSLDIAGAYPPEAMLESYQRTLTLRRGQAVEIVDRYTLFEPAEEIVLSVLTPCEVNLDTPGQVVLSAAPTTGGRWSGKGRVTYDADRFAAAAEEILIEDERLGSVWGERLTRVVFRAANPPQEGTWAFQIRARG